MDTKVSYLNFDESEKSTQSYRVKTKGNSYKHFNNILRRIEKFHLFPFLYKNELPKNRRVFILRSEVF